MGVPAALHLSTLLVVTASILLACARPSAATTTRHYKFEIRLKNVTRLCKTKSIVTVNGQFPGPTIVAREGDRVVVNVVNHVQNNITLHWHGVRQLLSGWADGPVYITQCPIQAGRAYVYNFTVTGQVGTLWWHAHASWLRATVYGPLVILPKPGVSYPFPKPYKEIPILLGEWFNADTEAVIAQALQTGAGPNVSDAYTINGLPGPLYNCSNEDTFELKVKPGKTYLLRLINAALNNELFFTVANHTVTVVEADANYVVPFTADVVLLSPGQTTNVLLHALPSAPNGTSFLFAARPYATGQGTFDNTTTVGILRYHDSESVNPGEAAAERVPLVQPASFPSVNGSTDYATNFTAKFRSLAPPNLPREVDRRFFFTVGLGTDPCPENQTCLGPNGTKFAAAINNVSFALPSTTSLLQARYQDRPSGVYTADFPGYPPFPFNYTGEPPNNTLVSHGTRVVVVPFNTSVELVLQDTGILGAERHPLHFHGHNFFVVGQGFGNFDRLNDPPSFNLVDPVQRNTFGVPLGGWLAVRFTADNPGAWLMHCHVDVHLSWGMRMAWVVNDGAHPNQKLPPPPPDLPEC